MVRTLRIVRLLKYFRYSRSLQLIALGFYRAMPQLKALGFSMLIIGLFCTVAIYEAERHAQPDQFGSLLDATWFTIVSVFTVGYGDLCPKTILGRIVAVFTFIVALSICAGIVGVLGNSFGKVLEEEVDPDVDPIELFVTTREHQLKVKRITKDLG